MANFEKWLDVLGEFWNTYPPDQHRCARCKAPVDPMDERWRMGLGGWEHACPDMHPQPRLCLSERIELPGGIEGSREASLGTLHDIHAS